MASPPAAGFLNVGAVGEDRAMNASIEDADDGWSVYAGRRRPPPSGEPRQAVVLIHGVGNQEPMRTLRSFTHGLGLRRLFSSPDRTSGSDELRRLSEPPSSQRRASTDFYELYWAHLAPDSDVRTSLTWAFGLLVRPAWWRTRGPAARLVATAQVLLVVAVGLLGWAVGTSLAATGLDGWWGVFSRWQWWVGLIAGALHIGLGHFLRRVLSDAARYLTPRPANIEARQAIRDEGMRLLRRLHADERYVRIVVVGHSLGSVIGYDLLRSLWDELRHPDPERAGAQPGIDVFDAAADRIDPTGQPAADDAYLRPESEPADVTDGDGDVGAFQAAQHELWRADRRDGVPWLVTDFVTLGSPLAYASLLLRERDDAFGGRRGLTLADQQALKEYPRCPPIRDELEDSRFYTREYVVDGTGPVRLRVGHTAAPFGPTRWTNLYVPAGVLLRGDVVAGPVAPQMGPGVADVPVRVAGRTAWARLRRGTPLAHISYWWRPRCADGTRRGSGARSVDAVDTLREALRLDDIEAAPSHTEVTARAGVRRERRG